MQIFLILALVLALIAVIFALQNTVPITVSFLFWQFHGSLALVLIISLAAGVLITALFVVPELLRGRWSLRKLRKQMVELESNLDAHKQRLEEADHRREEQSSSLQSQASEENLPNQPGTSQ